LFDGVVARRFDRDLAERARGAALDSLADVVSFLALPVAVVAATGLPLWTWAVLCLYLLAGLTRLAFFDAAAHAALRPGAQDRPVSHYRGLPTTYAALAVPLTALVAIVWAPNALGWALLGCLAVLAALFVADRPVPKPRGPWYGVFALVAMAVLIGLAAAP
jgi:CDP-diacylglycerol--serine O-phosphatidyltransferase